MRTHFSGIGDEWVATMLNHVAPLDASGKPDGRPRVLRSRSQGGDRRPARRLRRRRRPARRHRLRPDRVPLRSGLAALRGARRRTAASRGPQVEALALAFAGPKDAKGRQVYPGFPFDTGIAATQGIPGLLAGSINPVGRPFTATEMDVDERAERAAADPHMQLTATWSWTNLDTFSRRGGKLLFYHGVSDPWFSALDTVDYYERMTRANGGAAAVPPGAGSSWCRGWATAAAVPRRSTLRHAGRGRRMGRERNASAGDPGDGSDLARAQPAAVPVPEHAHYKGTGTSMTRCRSTVVSPRPLSRRNRALTRSIADPHG